MGLLRHNPKRMYYLKEMFDYFLRAWMTVTQDLYVRYHSEAETLGRWDQYTIVVLSTVFFYMICYLLHKWIEDEIKIQRLHYRNKKLMDQQSNYSNYDDPSRY